MECKADTEFTQTLRLGAHTYVRHMRTTLILDDDLARKAKLLAAEDHRTLSDVVNQALRELVMPHRRAQEAPPPYRAVTFGDPANPVAMEPEDLAKLANDDDRTRLGY